MPTPDFLFVYGTLRKDGRVPMAKRLHRSAQYIGQGTLRGRLYDLGSYPGFRPSQDPDDSVTGDIFKITQPSNLLSLLDAYEGCAPNSPRPFQYRRQSLQVAMANGTDLFCWVYVFNRDTINLPRIKNGDYGSYLKR